MCEQVFESYRISSAEFGEIILFSYICNNHRATAPVGELVDPPDLGSGPSGEGCGFESHQVHSIERLKPEMGRHIAYLP